MKTAWALRLNLVVHPIWLGLLATLRDSHLITAKRGGRAITLLLAIYVMLIIREGEWIIRQL
jgi:hypothetical protein